MAWVRLPVRAHRVTHTHITHTHSRASVPYARQQRPKQRQYLERAPARAQAHHRRAQPPRYWWPLHCRRLLHRQSHPPPSPARRWTVERDRPARCRNRTGQGGTGGGGRRARWRMAPPPHNCTLARVSRCRACMQMGHALTCTQSQALPHTHTLKNGCQRTCTGCPCPCPPPTGWPARRRPGGPPGTPAAGGQRGCGTCCAPGSPQ